MMVLFQNRIIYMPGIPLGARKEQISDYKSLLRGINWSKEELHTEDGKTLGVARTEVHKKARKEKHIVIVYFQGNASSAPPRLPSLSEILATLRNSTKGSTVRYTFYYPSYRGFWSSSGRPSQSGIEIDLAAIFSHIQIEFPEADIVLWGQSIGCGIAITGLSRSPGVAKNVVGLILETPFISIEEMLVALYPQKWLPYRYLKPFLWNHWDLTAALGKTELQNDMRVLLLQAEKDELVPAEHAGIIEELIKARRINVRKVSVKGALHAECVFKPEGRREVVDFLEEMETKD